MLSLSIFVQHARELCAPGINFQGKLLFSPRMGFTVAGWFPSFRKLGVSVSLAIQVATPTPLLSALPPSTPDRITPTTVTLVASAQAAFSLPLTPGLPHFPTGNVS
ncbi:hypothetical protein H920_19452 [Fukomys damarensis]|uniref:Uncharacterized protein n=1 Tax=Fukomys damarensis TaxID=885580 RepID=A0A091CNP4_FUKDA|nr:hypothetical protein H920_19452 [Fukomys damarensis]